MILIRKLSTQLTAHLTIEESKSLLKKRCKITHIHQHTKPICNSKVGRAANNRKLVTQNRKSMPTIRTTYLGDLRTENTHLQSGTRLITDAPCDNRGRGESFSPTDLLATSLGNCIMTIMGIRAMDNGFDLTGTTIDITKIMAENPRRVAEVVVEFHFPKRNYTDEQKQIIESVTQTSPVPLSLHPDLKQTILLNW